MIVRGLEPASAADLVTKFAEFTQNVMGKKINLKEVKVIPSHPDIYSAKITDIDDRVCVGQSKIFVELVTIRSSP